MNQESTTLIYGIDRLVTDYAAKSCEELAHSVGQNTGNLVFTQAIHGHLQNVESLSWDHRITSAYPHKLCVVPSANFLGSHTDLNFLYEQMKEFQGRILSIGLGAQASSDQDETSIPDGTKKWLRLIGDRSLPGQASIAVRGRYTLKVLETIGMSDHAVVTGCPSNFISSDPRLGETIARKLTDLFERVAVCSAHYGWQYLGKSERDLYRLMMETGGVYINQSPAQMIGLGVQTTSDMSAGVIQDIIRMTSPDLDEKAFHKHVSRYHRSYFSVSEWIAAVRRCSLVIGARIHGVMVALQAGIPALCIAHDARTKELCEVMQIPFLSREDVADGVSRTLIESRLHVDWSAYDKRRQQLLSHYVSFLEAGGASLSADLQKLQQAMQA